MLDQDSGTPPADPPVSSDILDVPDEEDECIEVDPQPHVTHPHVTPQDPLDPDQAVRPDNQV